MFHNVKTFHDVHGCAAMVPLNSGTRGFALIDWDDLQALVESGLTTRWFLNDNGQGREYVRCHQVNASGGLVGVARVLLGARAGQVVSYHDGNTTNLRRSNLYFDVGRAKRHDSLIVENAKAFAEPAA